MNPPSAANRSFRAPGSVRSVASLVAVAALVATTAGCQAQSQAGPQGQESPEPPAPPVSFQASVKEGAKDVRPDTAVTVSASQGNLHTVVLADPKGKELKGQIKPDGTWGLVDMLSPGTKYTIKATGESQDGTPGTFSRDFATLVPKVEATYRVTPDGQTVGVGMPVMVTFDSAVMTPEMRANVERRVSIKTEPKQEGSWGWHSERELFWRPKEYWKPNTKVTVNAPLRGVQTGEKKWITEDKGAAFTIAKRARISTVDVNGHSMTVRENGKVVGTYPVSNGQATANWQTRSGTKIITEKQKFMVMDAATLGVPKDDPNYYRTEVDYAMRVTNTGEFLHSAPWSVWAQGRRNVSHGCVNMGPRAAREMFNASVVGDVVDFVNSPRKMKMHEGVGVWLVSYDQWKARSALAKKATAKPSPSKTGKATPAPSSPSPATPSPSVPAATDAAARPQESAPAA
ncbi:hypothetical protein KILIM_052_00190 [Kineosphaera limosa NBRC 100340]|uniref:L,D-TPase catalytic domain-containing protein n=1 Tax=Kineosphaera limosa NBRC 100340 TaxID=1184609 RepID=K6WSX1_9MICO|nr:hypothetical protein KILIM_052_00190 [Kineosphaera limosa NBRC 100340]